MYQYMVEIRWVEHTNAPSFWISFMIHCQWYITNWKYIAPLYGGDREMSRSQESRTLTLIHSHFFDFCILGFPLKLLEERVLQVVWAPLFLIMFIPVFLMLKNFIPEVTFCFSLKLWLSQPPPLGDGLISVLVLVCLMPFSLGILKLCIKELFCLFQIPFWEQVHLN